MKNVRAAPPPQAPLEYAWGVVGHLNGVKNSDPLRAAHQEMQGKVVQASTKLAQSRAVYDAVAALNTDDAAAALDGAQRRIVESKERAMRLGGVALEGDAKERFNAIKLEARESRGVCMCVYV